jgi:hypothetical protein
MEGFYRWMMMRIWRFYRIKLIIYLIELSYGKIKNVQNEELKIKWIKVLAYICKIHASISKDKELLEVREEIKNLKKYLKLDD